MLDDTTDLEGCYAQLRNMSIQGVCRTQTDLYSRSDMAMAYEMVPWMEGVPGTVGRIHSARQGERKD